MIDYNTRQTKDFNDYPKLVSKQGYFHKIIKKKFKSKTSILQNIITKVDKFKLFMCLISIIVLLFYRDRFNSKTEKRYLLQLPMKITTLEMY